MCVTGCKLIESCLHGFIHVRFHVPLVDGKIDAYNILQYAVVMCAQVQKQQQRPLLLVLVVRRKCWRSVSALGGGQHCFIQQYED